MIDEIDNKKHKDWKPFAQRIEDILAKDLQQNVKDVKLVTEAMQFLIDQNFRRASKVGSTRFGTRGSRFLANSARAGMASSSPSLFL